GVISGAEALFKDIGKPMPLRVVKSHVEGLETLQYGLADAPCCDDSDVHAFQVVSSLDTVGNVPATLDDPLVRRDVIADKRQNLHDCVFRNAEAVAERNLSDRDAMLGGRFEVDMVRADAGGHGQLEFGRLLDPLGRKVCRPEWL